MDKIQLVKNITYMVRNGDYVAGHSIFKVREVRQSLKNLPDKILKEGLIIHDASRGLSHTSREFEAEFEDNLSSLDDFAEYSSGSVIIIVIPKELLSTYNSKYFSSYNSSSIVLEFTDKDSEYYEDVYGNPTKIAILPPIYVFGYFDAQKNIFVKNPNFAFDNDNKEISIINIKPMLDQKYKEMLEKNNSILTKKM